jgi:hypothetical protein
LEQRDKWGVEVKKLFQIQKHKLESVWAKVIEMDKTMGIGGNSQPGHSNYRGYFYVIINLHIFAINTTTKKRT